jgi:hypothetical protein
MLIFVCSNYRWIYNGSLKIFIACKPYIHLYREKKFLTLADIHYTKCPLVLCKFYRLISCVVDNIY